MPQLDPTWFASQLFWLLATFGMLYVLLSRVILPPLLKVMDERSNTVVGNLAKAESLKAEAEQARQQYESALADARLRSQSVLEDASVSIKVQAEKANAEMERRLANKMAEVQTSIEAKKKHLMTQLTTDSAELVAGIVEKFTHAKPDAARISAALQSVKAGE